MLMTRCIYKVDINLQAKLEGRGELILIGITFFYLLFGKRTKRKKTQELV
jgi:hypothetical protein